MRLVGTGIVSESGIDLTGRYYDELPKIDDLIERNKWAVENRCPFFAHSIPLGWASRDFSSYSGLLLPLSTTGEHVDMTLAYIVFD